MDEIPWNGNLLFLLFDVGLVHNGFRKVLEVLDLPLVVALLVGASADNLLVLSDKCNICTFLDICLDTTCH